MSQWARAGGMLALLAVTMLIGAGLLANSTMFINQIWPVEKLFDNPWATNNGSPRVLEATQVQSIVSETSNYISVPDSGAVIGARIEYKLTYIDGGANSPDASINFNGINVVKVRFLSHGQVITGTANVALDLLDPQNQITISHINAWGGWSKVSYDVVFVLGYDAPPTEDPEQGGGGSNNGSGADLWVWFNTNSFGIPNWILTMGVLILLILGR